MQIVKPRRTTRKSRYNSILGVVDQGQRLENGKLDGTFYGVRYDRVERANCDKKNRPDYDEKSRTEK